MLHCAPDGTPRPVVPLNEPLDAYYDRGGVMHDRHGGIVINVGIPAATSWCGWTARRPRPAARPRRQARRRLGVPRDHLAPLIHGR